MSLGSNTAYVCDLLRPLAPALKRVQDRGNTFVRRQARAHKGKVGRVEKGSLAILRERLEAGKAMQVVGDIFTRKAQPSTKPNVTKVSTGRHTGTDYRAANVGNDLTFRDRVTGKVIGHANSYRLPSTIMG